MSTYMDKLKTNHLHLKYLGFTIFLIIFDLIYEQFSHGIYSNFMRFSFLIPLIGGIVILGIDLIFQIDHPIIIKLWNMGLTTLVSGFILEGVFEIYGTTEHLVYVLFYVGGVMCTISIMVFLYTKIKKQSIHDGSSR